jgi:hypothetical protein
VSRGPDQVHVARNMLAYLLERATRKAGLATGHKPRHAGPLVATHVLLAPLDARRAPASGAESRRPSRPRHDAAVHAFESARDRAAIRLLELPPSAAERGNMRAPPEARERGQVD